MSEILNKYKRRKIETKILTDKYFDIIIARDGDANNAVAAYYPSLSEDCLSAYINFKDENCISGETLNSIRTWNDAIAEDILLDDAGLTFVDNGHIWFDKYAISTEEAMNKFLSSVSISSNEKNLKLRAVSGITQTLNYPILISNDGFAELKGGFFQGFFKLFGFNYEVLPTAIEDEWNLEFVIRPQNYDSKEKTLNSLYPENKGIFFYIGTRAENKFAQFYGNTYSDYTIDTDNDKFCDDFSKDNYAEIPETAVSVEESFIPLNNYSFNDPCNCECLKQEETPDEENDSCDYYFEDDYTKGNNGEETSIITTKDGRPIENKNYFEIQTDNKHLFFSRAKGDFTTKTWIDADVVLTGISKNYNTNISDNLYLNLHHGKGGLTVKDLEKIDKQEDNYNFKKDIKDNAFALKYNEDGSIGYRYLIKDCDSDEGFSIEEESSFSGLVKDNEWNIITVKIKAMNGSVNECKEQTSERNMRLYFFVNGYLKFVSKELPMFDFHELSETFDKQEGAPYNISLGGGTQGLYDSIWVKYWEKFPYLLPLEKNFAGTFIGDIRSFKFYTCALTYAQIKNNALFELGV